MPRMKNRCRARKTISGTMMATNAADGMSSTP
jgi:hypothetical protein